MEKQFEIQSDLDRHECVSWLEGQNIIFRCTQCSFVRQVNLATGQLSVLHKGDDNALHSGSHQPINTNTPAADSN